MKGENTARTSASRNTWRAFWDRGDWWRALILAAAYYALYELAGFLIDLAFPAGGPVRGEAGSASDVLISIGLPVLVGCLILVAFAASVGWLGELFARQRAKGHTWMSVGVIIVLAINVGALLSIDYASAGAVLVLTWLLCGLFVGFAEEVLTRGLVVNLMRKAGHGEIAVALVSAAVFAALHLGNVFTTTQGVLVTLEQVVYTFAFGIIMYLALRITRTLVAPILIHASTDPTLFVHGAFPAEGNLLSLLPAFSTYIVIVTGFVLLIVFIVSERRAARRL